MGATSTRLLMQDIYCMNEHDKLNWHYYSGDRFTIIPHHFYSGHSLNTKDDEKEEEEESGWWQWHWLL